jgi:hypothetical protein
MLDVTPRRRRLSALGKIEKEQGRPQSSQHVSVVSWIVAHRQRGEGKNKVNPSSAALDLSSQRVLRQRYTIVD